MHPTTANSSTSCSGGLSSAVALRRAPPGGPGGTPSGGEGEADHRSLVSLFPIELRDEIARTFPTVVSLKAFHDELVRNEIPLDRSKPVSYMLEATVARERELLLQHGSSSDAVNRRNAEGATSLHSAILCWNADKVRQLLECGAKPAVTVRPAQRKAPFLALASLAKKLRDMKGDGGRNEAIVDALNAPLHSATEEICTRALIAHSGENALTLAISYGAPLAIIRLLVEHCAMQCPQLLMQSDANGNPPLLLAAASRRTEALQVVELLLACRVKLDVNQLNGLKRTALMEAVRRGDAPSVVALLQAGADCAVTDNHGLSATAHALLCEYPSLHSIMSDHQSKDGNGDVRYLASWFDDFLGAVRRGQAAVVTEMLSDLNKSLTAARTEYKAKQEDNKLTEEDKESNKCLVETKAAVAAQYVAIAFLEAIALPGHSSTIQCLMTHGSADVGLADSKGLCLWQSAADKEGFETLLAAVCKPGAKALELTRCQALLQCAVGHGSVQYACHALEAGADIEQIDPATGCSALMTAVKRNDRPLMVELLKRGASIVGNAVAVPGNAAPARLVDCALATARDTRPKALARELVLFIVESCPDPYQKPDNPGLLLDLAVEMKLPGLVNKLIADRKMSPSWFRDRANSLLIEVVRAGSPKFAAAVLDPRAPRLHLLDAINGDADEALELARDEKKPAIFHLILKACNIANTNPPESLMRRLLWAVEVGCIKSCELILTQGELPLPRAAPAEENPLIVALQCGQHKVIEFLLGRGAHACARHESKASALSRALASRDWKVVEMMLTHDQYPHEFAAALPQLLKAAVANDNGNAFRMLVGASHGIGVSKSALSTMLQQAVKLGSLEACTSLLKRGANVNCTTAEGMPLLELALLSGHPSLDIVRLLFGNAAWGAARYAGRPDDIYFYGLDSTEIVKALVGAGASKKQKIHWMALMFCELRESGFTANDESQIRGLYKLFKTIGVDDSAVAKALYEAWNFADHKPKPDRARVREVLLRCLRSLELPGLGWNHRTGLTFYPN
jgi:ankyrin repeat protein